MHTRRTIVTAGVAGLAATGATLAMPSPASAIIGGPYHSGGGGDCSGRWHSLSEASHGGQFSLRDNAGGSDNDYCYIEYYPAGGSRRVSIGEDTSIGSWQYRNTDLSGIGDQITFKVCEERENDPDLCSSVHTHSKK
jgi:hypothetical protein